MNAPSILHSPVARLYQPGVEDVRIGDWLVTKGSLVTIPFFVAQGDARWFAQPERFDPERFLGEPEVNMQVTLRPAGGLRLVLTPRAPAAAAPACMRWRTWPTTWPHCAGSRPTSR